MARRRTPEPRRTGGTVTIRDIAAAVGVSVATVSNVLNERPNVGPAIRKRVLASARRLGYKPNRAAQAMRAGRTRAIGLVLPDLTNPFFPELAQAVEFTARAAGLLVCLVDSQGTTDGEAAGFDLLSQHAVDAVIWCPVGRSVPAAARAFRRPIVLIDRPRPGYDVVQSDYAMGGRLLAEHAIQMGHRTVGLLPGPVALESARQRRGGFVETAAERLTIAWESPVGFDGALTPEAIMLLDDRAGATLVACGNDLIAISVLRHLAGRGVAVPGDVSVTGFDDIRWSDVVTPRLTTIAQPVGAIGARAVEVMRARIAGAAAVSAPLVYPVQLVVRDSVRRLA